MKLWGLFEFNDNRWFGTVIEPIRYVGVVNFIYVPIKPKMYVGDFTLREHSHMTSDVFWVFLTYLHMRSKP